MTPVVTFYQGRAGLVASDGSCWIIEEQRTETGIAIVFRGIGEEQRVEPAAAGWREWSAAQLEAFWMAARGA